ncbi:MAG: GIY-YIG nuclease family protein [Patescibacteria group bacterium]|nr:GIY-YIG nuclease family protein [Patescibacteria group bacterium]
MKIEISQIPEKTGIYIFKDKNKRLLYVGKSVNLKKRIIQHLKSNSLKIKELLTEADSLEILKLDSEVEAILKEAELIKKFDPPYNILLRDDTQYFYLVITKNLYPKLVISHQPQKYKSLKILGPFTEGKSLRTILKILRKEIPFCTCLKNHKSSCLNSLIGLCYGWCCKENEKGNPDLYKKNILKIIKILKGNFKKLKIYLLEKLENLIRENKLEEASKIKKEITALKKLISHKDLIEEQKEIFNYFKASKDLKNLLSLNNFPSLIEAYDISHWTGEYKVGVCAVFLEGKYLKKSLKKFRIKFNQTANDPQMIYEVLHRRLKHHEWQLPDIILIDGGRAQFNFALKALKEFNLENYVKIISIAKPKEEIFFDKNRKAVKINNLSPELGKLIKFIDKKTHQLAINYHRRLRNIIRLNRN